MGIIIAFAPHPYRYRTCVSYVMFQNHMCFFTCEISQVILHMCFTCEISHGRFHMGNYPREKSNGKFHMGNTRVLGFGCGFGTSHVNTCQTRELFANHFSAAPSAVWGYKFHHLPHQTIVMLTPLIHVHTWVRICDLLCGLCNCYFY